MNKLKKIFINLIQMPLRVFSKISLTAIISNSKISSKAAISGKTRFYDSKIDDYSYIGRNGLIMNTEIGKYCSIADDCKIGCAEHPIEWVSTSPVFHKGRNILRKNFNQIEYKTNKRTIIENDVWIGNNVLIKAGIRVGNGAIIGMGSIVTKDVEPYSIIAGVPAKKIRDRFSEENKKALLDTKWWEWSDEIIEKCSDNINDVQKFLDKIEEGNND